MKKCLIIILLFLFSKTLCFGNEYNGILGKWKLQKNQDMKDKINLFDGDIEITTVKKKANLHGDDFYYIIFDREKHALACSDMKKDSPNNPYYLCPAFILKTTDISSNDRIDYIIEERFDDYFLLKINLLDNGKVIGIKFRPLIDVDSFDEDAIYKDLPYYERIL